MTDEEQAQTTGLPESMYRIELGLSQRMIALGFDPAAVVYGSSRGFSQEAITKALFMSERHKPEVVEFNIETSDEDCILPMEVELLRMIFVTDLTSDTNQLDPWDDPRWYLRGHLGRCSLNPNGEVIRMHAYLSDLLCHDLYAQVQIVRELPVRNPATSFDGQLIEDSRGRPCIADRVSR